MFFGAEQGHLHDGGVGLGPDGLGGRLAHADDLGGVLDGEPAVADAAVGEDILDDAAIADENDFVIRGEIFECGDTALEDGVRARGRRP